MHPDRLAGFRVAILSTDLFEEPELTEPRKFLQEAGAQTFLIAPHGGEIQAAHHGEPAELRLQVDQTLAEADPEQFDALLLPGGKLNSEALRGDALAVEFVRHFANTQRAIAAICHGGLVLIAANLVKGRHLTSYHAVQQDFVNAGAFWYDKPMVRDGNLVTSRQPADIPSFNQEMLNLFIDQQLRSHAAA